MKTAYHCAVWELVQRGCSSPDSNGKAAAQASIHPDRRVGARVGAASNYPTPRLLSVQRRRHPPACKSPFMTTHSPVALRELSGNQLFVARGAVEQHDVRSIGTADGIPKAPSDYTPMPFLAPNVNRLRGRQRSRPDPRTRSVPHGERPRRHHRSRDRPGRLRWRRCRSALQAGGRFPCAWDTGRRWSGTTTRNQPQR